MKQFNNNFFQITCSPFAWACLLNLICEVAFFTLSSTLFNEITCISKIKVLLLKLILKNKYRLFITTHFPSGNAKMKKVLLYHACKINISATTDIPRKAVINQNEKVELIASLVHLWSACQAKMSSYPRHLLYQTH